MKIIVTEEGRLWNAQSPVLAQYAGEVIVISYYTDKPREHQGNYQYLDVKIPAMMGMDENGAMTSIRYRALCENQDKLLQLIDHEWDVLILSDDSISTLYPYKLLQLVTERSNLHLWTISPFSFESRNRIKAYQEMIVDLSNTRSVLAMEPESTEEYKRLTLPQYYEHVERQMNELLPIVHRQIERMHGHYDRKYFFDFNKKAYIDTTFEKGFIHADDSILFQTLGLMSYEGMVEMKKKNQLFLTQRSDGKELCHTLKQARRKLAEANGIDFQTEECSLQGACGGTCPKCDEELRYLMERLEEIDPVQRVYPPLRINEKFISGHGNQKQE